MRTEGEHHDDGIVPFWGVWLITALMVFAVLALGAVGVYKMWLTATVRPAGEVR